LIRRSDGGYTPRQRKEAIVRTIVGLFAKSPFRDFESHQEKIAETVSGLDSVFDALFAGDLEGIRAATKVVSQLEHEADLIKDTMRNQMPRTLFMPVARVDLLDILSAQDDICDGAEDIGVLLGLRPLTVPEFMTDQLKTLITSVRLAFDKSCEIIKQFDVLLAASFRGPERVKALAMIDQLGQLEHLADKEQDKLLKLFFRHEETFKPAEIYIWMKVIELIGDIANNSEHMANRVRLVVAA
jgi:predicted phosphate transport protein (TIGR00153 family)